MLHHMTGFRAYPAALCPFKLPVHAVFKLLLWRYLPAYFYPDSLDTVPQSRMILAFGIRLCDLCLSQPDETLSLYTVGHH